jgi:DNA-binding NtrC family response regulator
VSVTALEQLCCRRWPFNIRELESAVRRALLLCESSSELDAEHFAGAGELAASPASAEGTDNPAPEAATDHPMAQKLREALERHGGNADEAAQELGISRSQLYRRAKKHGVVVSHYKR